MNVQQSIEMIRGLIEENNIPPGGTITLADRPENREVNTQVAQWLTDHGYNPVLVPAGEGLDGTAEGAAEAAIKHLSGEFPS